MGQAQDSGQGDRLAKPAAFRLRASHVLEQGRSSRRTGQGGNKHREDVRELRLAEDLGREENQGFPKRMMEFGFMDWVSSSAVRVTGSEEGPCCSFDSKVLFCRHHFHLGMTSVFFWVARVFEGAGGLP